METSQTFCCLRFTLEFTIVYSDFIAITYRLASKKLKYHLAASRRAASNETSVRYRKGTNRRKIQINLNYDERRCYLIQRGKRVAVRSKLSFAL